MRICIDIDGTLCTLKEPFQTYKDVEPLRGAAEKIKSLRKQGAYIIFCTARHMKSCESNVGQVIARQGHILFEWLARHDFEYDELWFGKPYADLYIDDKAFRFNGSWSDINETLIKSYL